MLVEFQMKNGHWEVKPGALSDVDITFGNGGAVECLGQKAGHGLTVSGQSHILFISVTSNHIRSSWLIPLYNIIYIYIYI